ncbi:MAG TPA: hypothetical protein VFQ79_24590 [Bryobacteraceae bacterium]|nr:hypothetical protein [Bryobacteraceae bacterium]
MPDRPDLFDVAREDLKRQSGRITVALTYTEAWSVLGQLQLAARHPGNTGPGARIARQFAELLQQEVSTTPMLAAIADLGWNPEHDT